MASSKLERKDKVSQSFGTGECQLGARFWVYGCFPHNVLREAGERTEDRTVLNGLRGGEESGGRVEGRRRREDMGKLALIQVFGISSMFGVYVLS